MLPHLGSHNKQVEFYEYKKYPLPQSVTQALLSKYCPEIQAFYF